MTAQSDVELADSEYYSPDQLAVKLNMSVKWVEKHTQAQRIPGQTKMGRAWRYNKLLVEKALLSGQLLLPPKSTTH